MIQVRNVPESLHRKLVERARAREGIGGETVGEVDLEAVFRRG